MDWISIKDRVPEQDENIGYVFDGEQIRHNVDYDDGIWYIETWRGNSSVEVTHWMPLPNCPEKQEG